MAKRKNTTLKRVLTKSGQVYFFKGGKRIATKKGEKLFTKELSKGKIQIPKNLTPSEELFLKRSKAAKKSAANTFKFQGRPIPRIYAVLLKKLYPKGQFGDTMDLGKWREPTSGQVLFTRYSDIQRMIDDAGKSSPDIFKLLTEMGYFRDKKGRTALIDICEILQQKEYDKFKFILIDPAGDEVRGRVRVCLAITEFEVKVTSGLKEALGLNVVKTYFDYSPKYDFIKKTFDLDLTDQDPETNEDNRYDFQDLVQENTGQLTIKINGREVNKFKDVLITYSLS